MKDCVWTLVCNLQDAALFSHEDQDFGDVTETVSKNNPVTVAEIPDLLTVNQILESVKITSPIFLNLDYKVITLILTTLFKKKGRRDNTSSG